jgi:Meiotically up-regulated gene 113
VNGFVYFAKRGKRIKIGCSKSPLERIDHIRPKSKLILAIRGTHQDEKELHKRFAEYRVKGEWFEDNEPLRQYMKSCTPANIEGTGKATIAVQTDIWNAIKKQAKKNSRPIGVECNRILEMYFRKNGAKQ